MGDADVVLVLVMLVAALKLNHRVNGWQPAVLGYYLLGHSEEKVFIPIYPRISPA